MKKTYSLYVLEIATKFDVTEERMVQNLENLYRQFLNQITKHSKFDSISFIIGISNTDSKDAKTTYIHTGKKGRPKKIVLGTKIKWHYHIYVFSNKVSCSSYCNHMKSILTKKKDYKVRIYKHDNLPVAVMYLDNQCLYKRGYGIFSSKRHKNKKIKLP